MAQFGTLIESALSQETAFGYMTDFSSARISDPSVRRADRVDREPVGRGSTFDPVARFAGSDVELRHEIFERDPPRRVVLEARRPGFVSRDTLTVEAREPGCLVHYDARLELSGARGLLDWPLQRVFDRIGAKAEAGMRSALNP